MKKNLTLIALFVATLFVACGKDESNGKSELISVTGSATYNPAELAEAIVGSSFIETNLTFNGVSDVFQPVVVKACRAMAARQRFYLDTLFAHKEALPLTSYRRNWHIESYAFTYRSTSAAGQPIVLSGRVSFPAPLNGAAHEVQSLSLMSHVYSPDDNDAPSRSLSPFVFRTMFNSAVIEPDYQGYGASNYSGYCGLSMLTLGKQSIDCIAAALEVMKAHGVTLAANGYTTAWGYSSGQAAIVGTARYYDERLDEESKKRLNLKSLNVGGGVMNADLVIRSFSDNQSYDAALTSIVLQALSTLPKSEWTDYQLANFLPQWMQYQMMEYNGQRTTAAFALMNGCKNKLMIYPEEYTAEKLQNCLSEDMFCANGHLDYKADKTLFFLDLLHRLCDWSGWSPSMDIYLTHCDNDQTIPYEQNRLFYEDKKSGGKVHWKNPYAPGTGVTIHVMYVLGRTLDAITCEDPAKAFASI